MDSYQLLINKLKQQKILPLFYHADASVCIHLTKALYAAGIRMIEFTNRGDAGLTNFKALVKERNDSMKDLSLAIGTIRTAEQANKFIDAGADLLISPVFDADVCDAAYINKILWIPGCMTPTEIHSAENAGCILVKLFPGNILGPSFVTSVKELFPNLDFMPTGGVEVNKENLQAWFAAGVCSVGIGSKLITKQLVDEKNYAAIEEATKKTLQIITKIK
jgi:2-dehydro-3-deoxyphosphogluconate aldolase / (4S)-4-hydroxy-2-oxoglutarate aldolase